MKTIIFAVAATLSLAACSHNYSSNSNQKTADMSTTTSNIHQFTVEGLNGETINLADYKGKKILIVNTASECGYTPQYDNLEKLYEAKKDKLVIIGFPSNDFGGQEPGTAAEIGAFCKKNYGVTFPMAAKVVIKGDAQAPIYKWLTHKDQNGIEDYEVKWNFNKFLINESGQLIGYYDSKTLPEDIKL